MIEKNQIDMTKGSMIKKEILFVIPLILTAMLQLLYNAVDVIVVGKFAGTQALSAVGSTGPLINLLVNVFMGLSIGTSAITAVYFGAKDKENIHKVVHTSVGVAIISGIILLVVGIFATPTLLKWMGTPDDVIDQAILYLRIFFIGMPFNLLYNFCAAILRAVGDTKRPLVFLAISGVINVILNLILVIIFKLDVAGVAFATIISQAVSAILICRCLMKSEDDIRLEIRKIRIYKQHLLMITEIGLPAGVQGSFFSISNVLIQSSINQFGSVAMAGNAASSNLEGFIYAGMNCVHQVTITFAAQNLGAKQYKRVKKNLYCCFGIVTVIGVAMCMVFGLFGKYLIRCYTDDVQAIAVGIERLNFFCSCYFLCGIMDVITGHLRGVGHSVFPMIVTLCGVCLFRIVWVFTVFEHVHSLMILYISYPISWVMSFIILFLYYQLHVKKSLR